MPTANLFLGFPIDEYYRQALDQLPLAISSAFISERRDYLQLIEQDGITYLGKSLGECLDVNALDLMSLHVISMLKRLVPSYSYDPNSLKLLGIMSEIPQPFPANKQ